jgi:hypothetical protein
MYTYFKEYKRTSLVAMATLVSLMIMTVVLRNLGRKAVKHAGLL